MTRRLRALPRLLLAATIVVGTIASRQSWAFLDNLTGTKLVVKGCTKACQRRGRPWFTAVGTNRDLVLPIGDPQVASTQSRLVVSLGSGPAREVIMDEPLQPGAWDVLKRGSGYTYDAAGVRIVLKEPKGISFQNFRGSPGRLQVALGPEIPTVELSDFPPFPVEVVLTIDDDRYCTAFTPEARKNKLKPGKRWIVKRMTARQPCVEFEGTGGTTTTTSTSTSTSSVESTTFTTTSSSSSTMGSVPTSTSSTTSTIVASTTTSTSSTTSTSPTTSSTSTSSSSIATTSTTTTSTSTTTTSTSTTTTTTTTSTSTTTTSTSTTTSTTVPCGLVDLGFTVRDTCAGLEWEKKNGSDGVPGSGTMDPANLNDVDNRFEWAGLCESAPTKKCQPTIAARDACRAQVPSALWTDGCETCGGGEGACVLDLLSPPADVTQTVWQWVVALNAASFANHADWRLPTSAGSLGLPTGQPAEIESIIEPPCNGTTPCIDAIFGPTSPNLYFSASSRLDCAWGIFYGSGNIACNAGNKDNDNHVRAVRSVCQSGDNVCPAGCGPGNDADCPTN